MDIEVGMVLEDESYDVYQILKKISDGYLVLYYESAHYVYNVRYITFEEAEKMKLADDWSVENLFDAKNIEHIDNIGGFCKYIG